uniref:NACHT domain-containing protein n=1 Tax=Tetraodon nigroviridis TaxID=99883 RepID=H3C7G4_TETNG
SMEEEKDRTESSVSSCVSLKSDRSMGKNVNFNSGDSGPAHTTRRRRRGRRAASLTVAWTPPVAGSSEDRHRFRLNLVTGRSLSCLTGTSLLHQEVEPCLKQIYTELYITEGQSEEVNTQHEVRQLETTSKKSLQDTPIRCQDIFRAFSEQQKKIRVVLTNGVAGVGKTFSVQKFSLDWAEGLENQDLSLVLLLSFRELNLVRDEQHSLLTLLHVFHPTLQKIRAEDLTVCKLLLIFDGLDESRLSLDFSKRVISDVTQVSSVNALLVNLIQGNLLPSAFIWI